MRIGIDPGLEGAIAFLQNDLSLLSVADMPIMAMGKNKRQVNAAELAKLIRWPSYRDKTGPEVTVAYLEYVSARPGQGVSSMFNFGVSYGMIQGILGALQIPLVLVTPRDWKKRAGLLGKDKDAARTLAQLLYPAAELGRKKDIGRADAILIARYGEER